MAAHDPRGVRHHVDRSGNGGAESLHRTRDRPVHAADGYAAVADRIADAGGGAAIRAGAVRGRGRGLIFRGGLSGVLVGRADQRELFAGVYAAEETHGVGDVYWGDSGGDSADDRLDGGDRETGCGSMAAVRDSVFLAVSPLPCDQLDVPGRLCAGGDTDAAGGGQGRDAHIPADCVVRQWVGGGEPVAGGDGLHRRVVLFRGAGDMHGEFAGVFVGSQREEQCASEMADARDGDAHSDTAGIDDVRQIAAVVGTWGVGRGKEKHGQITAAAGLPATDREPCPVTRGTWNTNHSQYRAAVDIIKFHSSLPDAYSVTCES